MKPSSWDKQLGSPLPLKSAASQSDQTNNPSKDEVRNEVGAGCKSPRPHLSEGLGESFFLDILFHRVSAMAMFQHLPRPTGRSRVSCSRGMQCKRDNGDYGEQYRNAEIPSVNHSQRNVGQI